MPLFSQVLQKFGYIKLADFGLLRDADDRIISVQDSSLIDASGGRVVGWRTSDIGPAVLPRWPGPASPGVATLAAGATSRVLSVQGPAVASKAAPHPVAVPEEDEWEWTIALARARAADPGESLRTQGRVATPPPVETLVRNPAPPRRAALQLQPAIAPQGVAAERIDMPRRNRAQTTPPPVAAPTAVGFVTAETMVQAVFATGSAPTIAPSIQAPPVRMVLSAPVVKLPVRAATIAPVRTSQAVPPPLPTKALAGLTPQPRETMHAEPPRRFPKGTEPLDPVALRAKLAQPLPPPRPRAATLSMGATRG
jgi:hypothetical protein